MEVELNELISNMVNSELASYIEENIFPKYESNKSGHGLEHVKYVINRSLKFASKIGGLNFDMVYVIAAYHDVGVSIDRDNHEKISGEILAADTTLKNYFTEDEIRIMSEACEDHRGSLEYEPRSIYGKIVSSADRNTSVRTALQRTHKYGTKHFPLMNVEELSERSRAELAKRFGEGGYSVSKMYFEDESFEEYLRELQVLLKDKEKFLQRYVLENGLKTDGMEM